MASTNYRILSTPASRGETNKQNAQHSTGPQSAEGKAISSQNARTHGLTSKQVLLTGEDPSEYERHRSGLHLDFKPATLTESMLVDDVAQSWWRRQRAYSIETAFIASRVRQLTDADKKLSPADAQARIFTDPVEISRVRLVMRYVTSAERAYNRALSTLMKLQAERKTEEKRVAAQAQKQAVSKSGFVSQNPKSDPKLTGANPVELLNSLANVRELAHVLTPPEAQKPTL